MDKGLYPGWNREIGAYGSDFLLFGKMIGLDEITVKNEIDRFCADYDEIGKLVGNSFLSDKLKADYLQIHYTRVNSFLKVF